MRLCADAEYCKILKTIADQKKLGSGWSSYDDVLTHTTPSLYSILSARIHGFKNHLLLVGPGTDNAEVLALQAMVQFVSTDIQVCRVEYGDTMESQFNAFELVHDTPASGAPSTGQGSQAIAVDLVHNDSTFGAPSIGTGN